MSLLKSNVRKAADLHAVPASHAKPGRSEALPFKQVMDLLEKALPAAQVVVITTLPRGSLQVAQPARVAEPLLKAYGREFHLEDRLTWQAILQGKPVTAADVLGDENRFVREFLLVNGLVDAAAAPLAAPVIEGYPGAVHAYRTAEQGPFTADELRALADAAGQADEVIAKGRQARRGGDEPVTHTLTARPQSRLFAFDGSGAQIVSGTDFEVIDERLRQNMADQARARLNRLNGDAMTADRVQLPDSRGDLWTFRAVTYASYPALTGAAAPVALMCLAPSCAEWSAVRPSDLQADAELARLIPAMKFMRQEFHRGPTLGEIAKQVHLSPFHFHRRFAELLGLTPKHFLLECQIAQAKGELLARKKELAQIATDCGFAHQSHFTSRFKQATGLTPTRWRRLAAGAGETA